MLLRALLSHYRRHPLQLLALWLILALATALWTGVWSLTQQARSSMTAGEEQLSGRQQLVRSDGSPVTREDFVVLRRQGLCVMPWLEVTPAGGGPRQVGVDALAMGCAGEAAATGDGSMELDGRPFIDIAEAARTIQEEGARGQLRLHLAAGSYLLPDNWQLRGDVGQLSTGQLADSFLLNLDALSVLVLLITALLVRSVYSLGLAQRREGLGLLVRYGVPLNRLRRYLLLELLALGALAVLPGYWLGLQLSRLLSSGFAAAMTSLFDTPLLATDQSLISLVLIVLVMLLVLLWAALDLFRTEARTGRYWSPGWTGLVLIAAGVVLVWLPDGLVWIFLGTGLLLLGFGLLTPLLLQRTLRTGARQPALALWRQREAGVLIRRLGLPLVALQFAAATVIAVQALVTTFEDTFYEWLDQRLSGDVYMEVPDGRGFDEVRDLLEASPVIRHWHPVIRGQGELGGESIDVMASDPASPLLQTWHLMAAQASPWEALRADAVLINEQLSRRLQLAPGDRLALTLAGETRDYQVAGVYADYGRPVGEVLLSETQLPVGFSPRFMSLTIGLEPTSSGEDLEALRQQLIDAWQVNELQERDNATIERIAVAIFDQTFALTRAISLLTLGLAAAALLMTGWVVLKSRVWYLQLLAAWGLSTRQMHRQVRLLMLGLMVRLALVAIPPGIALTWILVARINPVAFGWSLPMAVYPLFWLQLLGLLLIIGLLVAWWTVRGLGDGPAKAPKSVMLATGGAER